MKLLKYIGIAAAESIILMIAFFLTPTIVKTFSPKTTIDSIMIWVYIVFAIVMLAEYLYLWFKEKGKYFSVPLSLLFILLIILFYFNSPDNVNAIWAFRAVGKNFVMPAGIISTIASIGLWGFNKIRIK